VAAEPASREGARQFVNSSTVRNGPLPPIIPVVPLWTALKTRRSRIVSGILVVALAGAGLLTLAVKDRRPPTQEGATDVGAAPTATRDPLPVGGLRVAWDLAVGEFHAYAMDRTSRSIALKDFAEGPNGITRLEVVDAERGFVRWRRELEGSWLVNSDGTLAATADGLGFIIGTSFTNPLPLSAVQLVDGHTVWRAPSDLGSSPRLVGDMIVLQTDTTVTALDARSGSQRWQWRSGDTCGDGLNIDYGAGTTVAVECGRTVSAVAASDGSVRWRWTTSDGCDVHDTAASDEAFGVVVTCEPAEQRVHVLDGSSGAEKWKRAVPWNPDAADPSDPGRGAAGASIVALDTEVTLEIHSDGGTERFAAVTGASLPPVEGRGFAVAATTENLIYRHEANTYRDPNDTTTISAVDPKSGSTVWTRPLPLTSVAHAGEMHAVQYVANDTLFLLGSVDHLWPAVLVLVDARTGAMAASATGWDGGALVGVDDDGTVYVTTGSGDQGRLIALRATGHASGYLGTTTRVGEWPDACRLLSAAQYRSAFGAVPVVKPVPLNAPGAELPVPPRCQYLPPSIDGTELIIEVNWLAERVDEAPAVAAQQSLLGRDATTAAVGAARYKAWRWNETNTGVDHAPRLRLSFAVGRCVASVTTLGKRDALERVGGIVADNLADSAINPGCAA
jgi:hypothetical protein